MHRGSANVDTKELSYENFGVLGGWFYNKHVELFRSICLPCLPRYAFYTLLPSSCRVRMIEN